ncbi:MAG: hypothetical protein ABW127_14700 [Candidatus Thiodiazotropha endolucinida]
MNIRIISIYSITVLFLLSVVNAWADEYQETVDVFNAASESGWFFDNHQGYAVFPTVGKAPLVRQGSALAAPLARGVFTRTVYISAIPRSPR